MNTPRRRTRNTEETPGSPKRQRAGSAGAAKKFTACQRCHSHKIKCSGGQPCAKCLLVGCAEECQYEPRDRQVKVSESYLERILSENQRLKEKSGPANRASDENTTSNSAQNPLIGDRAWFHPYDPSAPPIFIGEAACTAFATRFRRFLTGSNATAHIPRTQFVKEENIAAANEVNVQWPSRQKARLLVKVALHQIGHIYHLVLRKSTLEKLEEIYQTGDFSCTVHQCKFFALFAFGEAYTLRTEPLSGCRVPGTSYFARALSLVQILPERTSIIHLETLLLLVCLPNINPIRPHRQRNAPQPLHRDEPQHPRIATHRPRRAPAPCPDLVDNLHLRPHVGVQNGSAVADLDDDIHLDLPSNVGPPQLHEEQFSDTDCLTANVKLARIVGETISKLYSRRKYTETFLQRVQKLLKALKNWVETLPEHIRLNQEDPEANKKPITSLHLAFNQCVILTTRPTLLHLLIKLSENEPNEDIPQPVLTLSEACIHAARHSHSLILTKWFNGTLPVFGYFHAHYLFSSALALAMSSFVPVGSPNDLASFETALEVLRLMSENGNLAAADFFLNLEQVKFCLDGYRGRGKGMGKANATAAIGPGDVSVSSITESSSPAMQPPSTIGTVESANPDMVMNQAYHVYSNQNDTIHDTSGGFTTAMAFLEPTMQDFLAQSDIDLGLLNPVDTFMNDEVLYTCHGL